MDKNTITGIALMLLVFLLFTWINKPAEQQQLAEENATTAQALASATDNVATPLTDTISAAEAVNLANAVKSVGTRAADGSYTVKTEQINATVDTLGHISGTVAADGAVYDIAQAIANTTDGIAPEKVQARNNAVREFTANAGAYKSFAKFIGGKGREITLSNKYIDVTFSTLGGIVQKVVLKDYKTELTTPAQPICLFDATSGGYSFVMQTTDQRIDTSKLNFVPEVSADSTSLTMSLPLNDNAEWAITYTLLPEDYVVRMDVTQRNMNTVLPANASTIDFNWHQAMHRNEKGRTFEERNSAIYYKYVGEGPDDLSSAKDDDKELTGRIKWVAFKNQFFSSVVIARQYFTSANLKSVDVKTDDVLKDMSMQATLPYNTANEQVAQFDWFFGPNDYPMLSSLDDKLAAGENVTDGGDLMLTRLVPLGWGLFRWINQLIVIPVFDFLGSFISNYGIIILLLTLFIKLILFPFTYKSYISQAKMRVLAPEIKEINEKYPGQENAMKRQQETMALYSRAGASPFSGCLPMLLQMPVLIAMFSFFPSAIELRGQAFLWAKDLSAPDVIFTLPFSIPFYGSHVSLFCLLMTVVNIIYTRINMQSQPGGNNMPGMKWMMYLMPLMFLFFFNDYASGLSYYYFLSLLITILQTYIFRHVIDEKKVRQQMLENAKKPKKKSGLMARLEAAQKRQEAMMREQAKQQRRR